MAGAMARGDDDKDEEIARLRGALRRATAAAMAYAETATAELGAMKSRLEQVERKSEEDARTIDELRARRPSPPRTRGDVIRCALGINSVEILSPSF
jgi:hypothetical protein